MLSPLEVVQQAPPLANELEQTAPRVVILLVDLKVLRQVDDPASKERYLDFWRARVGTVSAIGLNDGLFRLCSLCLHVVLSGIPLRHSRPAFRQLVRMDCPVGAASPPRARCVVPIFL
jgi:hypothetical protein